jgi:hypothetical protein
MKLAIALCALLGPIALAFFAGLVMTIKERPNRVHSDSMRRTAEMELEVYGQVMSLSVEEWYQNRGQGVPRLKPPMLPNPGMGVWQQCARKCQDFTEIRGDGRVIARLCDVHGYVTKPPPPPGRGSPHVPGRGICAHCEAKDGVTSH